MQKERPKVGVGVLVIKEGKILLGKRKSSHGEGTWSPAGGHLEYGETIEECAKRELLEETGLKALSVKLGSWTNDVIDSKHYITIFALVEEFEGDPQLLEPNKCEGWQWFSKDSLPSPLFQPVTSFLSQKNELQTLLARLNQFYDERDWAQFHSPKNLVMNLACEVGELIEPFRWLTEEASYKISGKTLEDVKDEVGDVFQVLLHLCHKLGIDPVDSAEKKLTKTEKKYPIELSKGKSHKYTEYQMSHTIKTLPPKYFIGIELKTSNAPGRAEKEIPSHWEKFSKEGVFEKIPNKKSGEIFALYTNYEGDFTKPYSCIIGCEVTSLKDIPTKMVGKEIPSTTYAVFTAKGEFPYSVVKTWQEIWKSPLKRSYLGDFEMYPAHFDAAKNDVPIYISIKS
jgi:8-oxo-dGTP diphosphatase